MSNNRKRMNGFEIHGRWLSPYKAHLYYDFGNRSEKGFRYPCKGGVIIDESKRRKQ